MLRAATGLPLVGHNLEISTFKSKMSTKFTGTTEN